jgi:hypothetical protein
MATWKKVIVSGSAANLASLQVDNLASGSVVIGGGSGNLSTTAINGTGNIVATSNASGLTHSGSFSGSFIGSGAGLSGVAASFPVTEKTNLVTADKFFIQNSVGTTSEFVTYGNLLTDLAGTNLAVESSDSLTLAATITGITSISSTSFTGSLLGTAATASYILQAVSASFATNATSASFASQAANATTASYVLQAVSASFATLAQTANTASYVLQAVSASFATNAANASTASFVTTAQTASFVATASFANNANLLDGLDSTVFATTGSNTFRANQIISGTLDVIPAGAAVAELVVTATGVNIGNLVGDVHNVTGSLRVNGSITGSLLGTASYASQALSSSFATLAQTANTASFVAAANVVGTVTSASYALTASFAANGGTLNNALTFGTGLSGSTSTFNGSTAVNVAISGSSALTTNLIPKWTGTGLANSNITDTGTQVQIGSGASSGVTVAAGGISVTGNSTFNNNLTVTGDLTVNGTASFINSTNTYLKDQFVQINSGSSTLLDSGLVSQYNAAGSGSAFYLDAGTTGPYGRWAVAFDVLGTSTAVTPNEFVVTAKINQASNPTEVAPPTWGSGSNGSGNMWITNAGDIFIYA